MEIGQYKVVARLGEGGMGEVHRARDARLNRDVAIKLLHSDALQSADRRARFESEARAASALNHPNIVTIHFIGDHEGKPYLVSELIEGETLRAIVGRSRVPMRRVLDIAVQIADGLAAAHAAGVTHRDLKPENIMVTKDGRVKILDFGLAKISKLGPDDETRILHHTEPGMVMGSVCYMSPEQATGRPLDYRSDQFSFGLVLHEMVSGQQTFRRDSGPETMAAIIREEPAPLDPSVNPPLRWVLDRLLSKSSEERYASTRDLYRDLRNIREHLSEASSSGANRLGIKPPSSSVRPAILWTAGASAVLALALIVTLLAIGAARRDFSTYKFHPIALDAYTEELPRWSPDGNSVVYQANVGGIEQIFTKQIQAQAPVQLTHSTVSCIDAFWHPDSSLVYYLSAGDLWAVSVSGGAPEKVLQKVSTARVHPDGKTFALVRNGKLRVGGKEPDRQREFGGGALPAGASVSALEFSPDGSQLAVVASGPPRAQEWWIFPFPSGKPRHFHANNGMRGFSWFPDNRRLATTTYDPPTFRLAAIDTKSFGEDVFYADAAVLGPPSISPDGKRVVFSKGVSQWTPVEMTVNGGRMRPITTRGGSNMQLDWASSGNRYLLATTTEGPMELEDRSLDGLSHLTPPLAGVVSKISPRWAPDSSRFVFVGLMSLSTRASGLWLARPTGERPIGLDTDADQIYAPSWSPDGEWICYLRTKAGKSRLVKSRPISGAAPVVLVDGIPEPSFFQVTSWSPDGKWIAYGGREGLSLVSPDGKATRILAKRTPDAFGFSRDGRVLYAFSHSEDPSRAEWRLTAIDVATGEAKAIASFDLPVWDRVSGFSMHPDSKRFTFSVGAQPYDIWMLEGFDHGRSLWSRLLGR